MKYAMVITTTDRKGVANAISNSLIKKGLAACVQVTGPIISTYRWKGKIANASEWLLLVKARDSSYKKIEREIARLHNYETPEIIKVPITGGMKSYLNWIDASTKGVMQ